MTSKAYEMDLVKTNSTLNELEYLILASGSDQRAYAILSQCDSTTLKKIVFIHFAERLSGLPKNNELFDYLKYNKYPIHEINCSITDPTTCLDEFAKIGFDGSAKVGIDISCLTKPYFYYIIKLLKKNFNIKDLPVFYTEPKSYRIPKGIYEAFHTSSGELEIISMPGFIGEDAQGKASKLVILLGFDGDLSKEINEDVSPNETILVNGFPSYVPKFKDISLTVNEKLVNDHGEIRYAKANNPFETYNVLQAIKEKTPGTLLKVAPLGTKPMALGACLFALHNPEVRIIYPMPKAYKNDYSESSWNSWVYNLPLSL